MTRYAVLFTFSLLSSSYAATQDFCIADLSRPQVPSGFHCKNSSSVTIRDFVYSGLATPAPFSSLLNTSSVPAYVDQFPALNNLGLSIARADFLPGGVFPMHSHPFASELLVVVSGKLTVGLISTNNDVYYTNVKEGDIVVFPRGLQHFLINSGDTNFYGYGCFSNDRPGIQVVDNYLFGNDLPSDILAKATFIDHDQIKKLKGIFGGTN